eukprot:g4865.t1
MSGQSAGAAKSGELTVEEVRDSKIAYPTGNPNFSVVQPFPSAFGEQETDPFLMCDEFGPTVSKGAIQDPDEFPVGWHPHVGMDICTYMREGVGRHADSLGNRGNFSSPGFQWISVGSGIEHAEGGGTPAGETTHGFQLWVNVPRARKNDDPRYGTEDQSSMPQLQVAENSKVTVIAGPLQGSNGPFMTAQPVQICDYEIGAGESCTHTVPGGMETVLVYVYKGNGSLAGTTVTEKQVAKLARGDTSCDGQFTLQAGDEGSMHVLLFSGKRLGEPIAWHGPFVMSSRRELQKAFEDYQMRRIPRVRAEWDYKRASAAPGAD